MAEIKRSVAHRASRERLRVRFPSANVRKRVCWGDEDAMTGSAEVSAGHGAALD